MKLSIYLLFCFCVTPIQSIEPSMIIGLASMGIGIIKWSYTTARWYCYPTVEQKLLYEKNNLEKQKERARLSFNECIRKPVLNKPQCETLYNEWKALSGFRKSH
jgi:hypothetical protein